MMDTTRFLYTVDGGVASLVLTPPDGRPPTLDSEVLSELERCIDQARADNPGIVLLRSASERFFCVGANINVLKKTNEQAIVPWVMQGHRVLNQLEDLPMPVVAVVEGYAMGGGLELALACDLVFASDAAQLAQSEAGLGFIPGWGGSRRLVGRIGAAKAKYYYYSGKMMDAAQAAEIGLVDFVGSKAELEAELAAFSASVISNSRNAISQYKAILNDVAWSSRNENAAVEAFRSVSCLQDPDTKRRLHDFLSKKGKK